DLGEAARPAGALVVDLLALGEPLQPLDGAVDLHARALRDLADRVAVGVPRALALAPRDRQHHEARVIVALAGVRVEIAVAEELRQPLVARRLRPLPGARGGGGHRDICG